jgi:hypothetical protein
VPGSTLAADLTTVAATLPGAEAAAAEPAARIADLAAPLTAQR